MIPKWKLAVFSCCLFTAPYMTSGQQGSSFIERYRALAAKGTAGTNAELETFLKSMTPHEMLECSRQGCEDALGYSNDVERVAACSSTVVACLTYYFDNSASRADAARVLIGIIADETDSTWLRAGIVGCLKLSKGVEFGNAFRDFALLHVEEIEPVLSRVIENPKENSRLRYVAIHALATLLDEESRSIWMVDANVRAAIESTHVAIRPGELIRANQLSLTSETSKALEPAEKRILKNAELLARIAGEESEPAIIRQHAERVLKTFQSQPIPRYAHLDALIAKLDK